MNYEVICSMIRENLEGILPNGYMNVCWDVKMGLFTTDTDAFVNPPLYSGSDTYDVQ